MSRKKSGKSQEKVRGKSREKNENAGKTSGDLMHLMGSVSIDSFLCHAMKNKSKTIQCKKIRNNDVIEDK